jgi:hypothetical protein
LSVLASGKPPSALRSQIVSPSQVISKTPPVPGASHLAEIGPERREQLLREPGRAQEPATLRTIANGDPWPEVAHQGLLKVSRQEQSLRDAPADPWIEHWHAERREIPGVAGSERQVVDEGGRGEKPVHR